MAKGGKIQHWKHGWIPLTPEAKAFAAGKGPRPGTGGVKAMTPDQKARAVSLMRHQRNGHAPTNPKSLGESIKPDPTEMTAVARGGGRPYSADHLTPDGRFTPSREAVHRKIIEDHLAGISPSGKQPIQYMNGGGPGSGKSSLRTGDNGKLTGYPATREANDMTGEFDMSQPASAVLIDPDAVKMMLPEVKDARAQGADDWAARSHEESSYLAKRIHAAALDRGLDLVYDGTGDGGIKSVEKKVALARAKNYRVEGNYIYLEPDEGVARAKVRGERTGRVVAESTIRETYKDVSSTFAEVAKRGTFDTLRVFDNNQPKGTKGPARLIATFNGATPDIKDPAAYQRFLANGE